MVYLCRSLQHLSVMGCCIAEVTILLPNLLNAIKCENNKNISQNFPALENFNSNKIDMQISVKAKVVSFLRFTNY